MAPPPILMPIKLLSFFSRVILPEVMVIPLVTNMQLVSYMSKLEGGDDKGMKINHDETLKWITTVDEYTTLYSLYAVTHT